jgi:hypothetical protein
MAGLTSFLLAAAAFLNAIGQLVLATRARSRKVNGYGERRGAERE